jgi:aromatic-L-amino-acid decarboxylase
VLAGLEGVVVPGVTQVQQLGYFGWFASSASPGSVLGDLAASGLGAPGITWQSAPALTEAGEVAVESRGIEASNPRRSVTNRGTGRSWSPSTDLAETARSWGGAEQLPGRADDVLLQQLTQHAGIVGPDGIKQLGVLEHDLLEVGVPGG